MNEVRERRKEEEQKTKRAQEKRNFNWTQECDFGFY